MDKVLEEKDFYRHSLFWISELNPEDWQAKEKEFVADPLLVGVQYVEEQAFLIDVFDPTPSEKYIVREFTE
jgi:hypothetical protein